MVGYRRRLLTATSGRDLWQRGDYVYLVVDCEVQMKIYCVTFVGLLGCNYEMCYPATNKNDAKKMCEKDFEWGTVVKIEEVI